MKVNETGVASVWRPEHYLKGQRESDALAEHTGRKSSVQSKKMQWVLVKMNAWIIVNIILIFYPIYWTFQQSS